MDSEGAESYEVSSIKDLKDLGSCGALKLLKDIQKVEKVKPKIPGDDYIYHFHIKNKTLLIPSSKMLNASMFARRYLEEFNELPKDDISENWRLIVKALKEKELIVQVEDNEENDETYAAETFLNVIRSFQILNKEERDQYKSNKHVLFCHNGNLYLPSEIVKKVLDSGHINIKIRRLNQLIKKYKIGTSTFRYGKKENETLRCWIFSQNLLSDSFISITELANETGIQMHE